MRAEDVLPHTADSLEIGGITIRKGSVGAFLANAAVLRDPAAAAPARAEALRHIEEALPALRALGLFDVFEIRDAELRAFVAKKDG